ncbi:MAG: NAD(P)-dependent oxidoreductase [Phycisphaerae bacterium]|nr:NAD(P)-dependent oxidoreductase [Phycisphaerae bacterium]
MSDIKTIGFVGTGIMGASMCGHLQGAGYDIRVHNRTKSKADALVANGAVWCDTPAAVAEGSDVIFTIVGLPCDVESVILGSDGVLSGAREGSTIVDMTTSDPSLARRIYDEAKVRNVASLDAPVSGGDVGAKNATLAIMVGGDRESFEIVLPLFEIMGKTIRYIGSGGMGQHCKMVNQILISGTMVGIAEAFTYGAKAGLDMQTVLGVVSTGAAGSAALSVLGPRVLKGDFEPGFFIDHFVKDMTIAAEQAEKMHLNLPGLVATLQRYIETTEQGMGKKGTQGLCKSVAENNGVQL